MKIALITIYEPITNLGSFLQCYAMKTFLESCGHNVTIIEKVPLKELIGKKLLSLNPKRAFFLRVKKCWYTYKDLKHLNRLNHTKWDPSAFDCVIYGSDEIWNLHNKYFADDLFWGVNVNVPKIAYAISVGHMTQIEFDEYNNYQKAANNFKVVFARDKRTYEMLYQYSNLHRKLVCDPTMLIPLNKMSLPIKLPLKKYLLVYTYGLSSNHITLVKEYARKHNLIIVSPCFWHIWADKVIECSALQFSTLIANAECVFTTTFHGAIFTMLNHKKCCIFSQRDKVKDVVDTLGVNQHLISSNCTIEQFSRTIELEFPALTFESKLEEIRKYSQNVIKKEISKLKYIK